ncbi:MAG: glycosyltransferase family 4 protein [Anaerolineae bacterium]|nr:glycosyltransferase family 4 protein [Anaerolineae bacterium]
MRIAIDARLNYYRPGGIVEYTRHLIHELVMLDASSDYRAVQHIRDRETLAAAPNFARVNTLTPSHHRLERWALSVELTPYHLDILHSPDAIPPARAARRQVVTIHDLHYLHYPQFMTADSRRYYAGQIAWAVRRADHLLASSQATRADLMALLSVPADKITVHMLGVDAMFQPAPAEAIQACRARWGLPAQYVLFVGTFEPRKNIPALLRAYDLLRRDLPDAPPLVLAGRRGWLYEDIQRTAEALALEDYLIWVENPPRDDLPALYSGAVALALPSHYEGFGLTALEAMACGTPPVVSERSSLPEVAGDAGLLVNPDDAGSIADALRRLLTDSALHNTLRAAGLARAATFTWRRTAEIVREVYARVMAE